MNGDVVAEINYLVKTIDDGTAASQVATSLGSVVPGFKAEPTRVIIHDLRGQERNMKLDTNGFEVLKYEGSMQEHFENGSEAQRAHFAEMSDIIKKYLGASQVFVYSYIFRNRSTPFAADQCDLNHKNPICAVHCDASGLQMRVNIIKRIDEEAAEKMMQNQHKLVNTWRPLGPNAITEKPLTICDYSSIDIEKDIQPIDVQRPMVQYAASTLSPNGRDAHRWYYLSEMQSNEMFLFKTFDTNTDAAQCAFHTAFINKNVPPPNVEQKSIEMRFLVIYD